MTIPSPRYGAIPGSTGPGPDAGSGWRVTFDNLQSVTSGYDLMVPFRTVMDAASRIINGANYVSASFIEQLTGRTAYWNQKSGVLRIE